MNTLVALAIRCSLIFLVPTATDAISAQWNLDPTSAGLEYACQLDTEWRAQWTKRRCNLWAFKYDRYLHLGRYEVNAIVFTSAATNPCTIVDISSHDAPAVTIGWLAGIQEAFVFLGANN
jgi:hypothetical protein